MTWLSIEETMELMGVKHRWLFQLLSRDEITAHSGEKARNGKLKREIQLKSLPTKFQELYFARSTQGGRAGENKSGASLFRQAACAVSPPAVSPIVGATEEDLDELNRKAEALRSIPTGKGRTAAMEAVARDFGVTVRTVRNWLRDYKQKNLAGLVRKKRDDEPRALPAQFVTIAASLFIKDPSPIPSFQTAHAALEHECIKRGIEPPSYSWTRRWIKKTLPQMTIDFKRSVKRHKEDWRVQYEPCVLRKHHDKIRDICDGDWHHINIEILDDEGINGGKPYRPDICAIGDCCTGEILGFHIQKNGNALGIGLALRMAILPKRHPDTGALDPQVPQAVAGRFTEFYTDQGKDFTSAYIKSVMHELGGSTRECEGYHGQSKPIERWFKTLNEKFICRLPGYVGRNKDERPWNSKPTLTRRELFAKIYEWTFYEFHNAITRALKGLSPYQVLAQHVEQGFRPVIPDERQLDFLLMPLKTIKVHKWGIQLFGTKDQRNLYNSDLFAERQLIGQHVQIRYHPDDLGTLYVFHDNQFIGEVHQERYRGYREKDLKDLYRRRKLARQAVENTIKEQLARAQYPDEIEQVKAERIYNEELGKERRAIAANASPGSVPAFMPKYAQMKKYVLKKHLKPLAKKPSQISDLKSQEPKTKEAWEIEEPLPTMEEIFKREEKPQWMKEMEAEEEQVDLERTFKREKNP